MQRSTALHNAEKYAQKASPRDARRIRPKSKAHKTSDCEFIRTHFNASRIATLRNGVVRARATNDAAR
jgi:hypothetical protein